MTKRFPAHIDPTDHDALADWVASDEYDPKPDEFLDASPLRRVVAAAEAVERAREFLDAQVRMAHDAGLSWTVIGAALGISRQAARQRFTQTGLRSSC
jgi:hypothetical protein